MPWSEIDGKGWQVDYDALFAVFRGAEFAKLSKAYTSVEKETTWWGPTTYEATTDLERVKREVSEGARRDFTLFKSVLETNPESGFRLLCNLMAQARANRESVRQTRQKAIASSMENISKSVDTYENRIWWAKLTQKTSILALTVLPSGGAAAGVAVSAGTRLAALSTTTALQTTANYQEHGKVGRAAIAGIGNFVVGSFGLGNVEGFAQNVTVLVVEAGMSGLFSGTEALVAGDKADEAVKKGLVSAAGTVSSKALEGIKPLKNYALPIASEINPALAGAQMAVAATTDAINGTEHKGAAGPNNNMPELRGTLTYAGLPKQPNSDQTFIKTHILRRSP